jgi:hypothetical protein
MLAHSVYKFAVDDVCKHKPSILSSGQFQFSVSANLEPYFQTDPLPKEKLIR